MGLTFFDIAWMSGHDGPGKRVVLFLRQCHLRCQWCHAPHALESRPPLLFFKARCTGCGRCARTCPRQVHQVNGQGHFLNRRQCRGCGECILACPASSPGTGAGALQLPAREMAVDEVFELLSPQLEMVRHIGGLTLSGGEALLQHKAAGELLALCREKGFHTAVETSGTLPNRCYKYVAGLVDCWLFGLRPLHPGSRLPHTAIENLKYIASLGARVIVRVPVINGCTTAGKILGQIHGTMSSLGLDRIDLLPYNPDTSHYYKAMGEEYAGDHIFSVTDRQVRTVKSYFEDKNLRVRLH